MSDAVDSSAAQRIERFRSARHNESLAVLEGLHALKHAARFGAELVEIAASDNAAAAELAGRLAPDLLPVLERADHVAPAVYERLAPLAHPTGVIAIAKRPRMRIDDVLSSAPAPALLVENAVHLGNLGACVRVAAAAGARGVLAAGIHDPWAPEALRAGAGLQFALPVVRVSGEEALPGPIVAVAPDGESLGATALPEGAVLAFGSERTGLSRELLARADRRIAIPMRARVSSLNLATAVAVVLYAWRLRDGV